MDNNALQEALKKVHERFFEDLKWGYAPNRPDLTQNGTSLVKIGSNDPASSYIPGKTGFVTPS